MKLPNLWATPGFAALVVARTAHAAEKITKIGVLRALAGDGAADGDEAVDCAKLAVDEIRAVGRGAGYKLQFVLGDTVSAASSIYGPLFAALSDFCLGRARKQQRFR